MKIIFRLFAIGLFLVFFGLLAMTGTVLRDRRALVRQKKENEQQQKAAETLAKVRTQPPMPDIVMEQIGL